ncbi:MAG: glycerophosphodiester phosphodiesterase [SAR202 cluster bacterium]|nr:glycerophosphodiester phosphodiesterase [SAR202 cluster bacterium]
MKIYAHRGSSGRAPEMTLAAYLAAIEDGADGFECDVRLTSDNRIVCFHDSTTSRIADKKVRISKSSLAELRQLTEVLLLDDLIDLAIANHKDLLIETKHPVKSRNKIENELFELLEKKKSEISGANIKIEIISFSAISIYLLKSKIEIFKVSKYLLPALLFPSKKRFLDITLIRRYPKLVNRFKKLRTDLYLWTVNEKRDFELALNSGVAGVITDYPERGR